MIEASLLAMIQTVSECLSMCTLTIIGRRKEKMKAESHICLKVNNKLAGFVLVNSVSCLNRKDITHSIAEFFIMRKWRRKGIGKATAFELFNKLPGKWEVSQERKNKNAQIFWRSIINEYTQGSYEEFKTDDKFVQIFKSSSIYNKGAT